MWEERYERQIKMESIGIEGQKKLQASSALVIGAGGLGSPAIYYLASAGIGRLGICDPDTVTLSNLNRQILHFTSDIDRNKAMSAYDKIQQFAPDIDIQTYPYRLTDDNAVTLFNQYDIVLCCVDNKDARNVLNRAHIATKIPVIDAAVNEYAGYIFPIIDGYACYNCVYPETIDTKKVTNGILGATAGIVGGMEALEAIKTLLGLNKDFYGSMLYLDLMNLSFQRIPVTKSPACHCHIE